MRFPRFILVVLTITAVIGAAFIASANVSHDETRQHTVEASDEDPLGEVSVPEGANAMFLEPIQLPEIMIKKAGLPTSESRITNQELGNTNSVSDVFARREATKSPQPLSRDNEAEQHSNENNDGSNKRIVIRLASQTMDMVENGEVVNTFKVSSGKRGMQTPTGTFKVLNKSPRAYSKTYGLYMPYWMAFTTRGHGIHELPEWPNGYKEGESHLGTPVSHGCVRLGVGSAKTVYEWADVGTVIEVVS